MDRSCFMFGHSDCPKETVERIAGVIRKLYTEDGIDNFIVGSRGGFDRCARQALMMVKDSGANIKVMLLIAYHPSERGFVLPEGFDDSIYPPIENVPRRFAIVRANWYMADHADKLICYVNHMGNARSLYEYALRRKEKCEIFNIADKTESGYNNRKKGKEGPGMKKVVLMGDSIRMGYDKYVKEALDGVCEVYYPEVNCKYALETLRFAHEWKQKGGWPDDIDLVHWNCGLWDELELFEDEPLSSVGYYCETILKIHRRLKMLYPKAKIVFATSTAVLEDKCSKDFRRHNKTIEEYNAAAVSVLSGTDSIINDLYSLSVRCPESYHSDAVHYYTDEGTAFLGGKVLSVICGELGIDAKEVKLDSFEPEAYSKENIGY